MPTATVRGYLTGTRTRTRTPTRARTRTRTRARARARTLTQAVQYANTVHAQFRKVKRQRNKWNCELTAGVATIDGLDYVFTKCDANFLF